MSVNLYSFVENPFTDKAYFNYDKFKDVVYKAQRLMDDVVDLEEEKINQILNKIENDPEPDEIKAVEKNLWIKIKAKLLQGRRTGLSAIGLADAFAALGYIYGGGRVSNSISNRSNYDNEISNNSIQLAEEIYKQFAISAYKSSIDMAKERGAFPIWNYETEFNNPLLSRIKDELGEDYFSNYFLKGRRNIALLTIPPSGTISLLAGISSGIEPVYQLYYKRRVKVTEDKPYDFIDQNGDKWKEYTIFHPKFKEWFDSNEIIDKYQYSVTEKIENCSIEALRELAMISPYDRSTAYEIDPLQRVKLQSKIQQYIDHSISSTINLPKNTTEETVSNLYMEAWKQGCKGLCVYVDECRTGVLVSNNNTESKEFKTHDAPKRPKELQAEFHKIKVQGKDYGVFIGLLDHKPYEIFAYVEPNTLESFITGVITKTNKGIYTFKSDTLTIKNIIKETEAAEERTFTLMLSGLLRHGAHPKFIIDWINKAELEVTSFGKSIARTLKKYIKDDEKTTEKCPECNSEIIYKDGCKQCTTCGWSKCG